MSLSILNLTMLYFLILATTSFSGTFQQASSPGDLVNFSKEGRPACTQESSDRQAVPELSETVEVETENGIFQCPNEGYIKIYQTYSALEKHLSYGRCELCRERHTLLDRAKQMCHVKLTEGTSAGATSHDGKAAAQESVADTNQLARGLGVEANKECWALQ